MKDFAPIRDTSHFRQDDLISSLYSEMHGALYGYVLKRIGNRTDAEDVVQDVFLKLLEYTTLLSRQTITSFVYTIARNHVIDYLRLHARSLKAAEYFSHHAPRHNESTQQTVAVRELKEVENRTVASMSPRKAEVYMLYVHSGRSVAEISDALSLSRRTVENHIFAARTELRPALRYAL